VGNGTYRRLEVELDKQEYKQTILEVLHQEYGFKKEYIESDPLVDVSYKKSDCNDDWCCLTLNFDDTDILSWMQNRNWNIPNDYFVMIAKDGSGFEIKINENIIKVCQPVKSDYDIIMWIVLHWVEINDNMISEYCIENE